MPTRGAAATRGPANLTCICRAAFFGLALLLVLSAEYLPAAWSAASPQVRSGARERNLAGLANASCEKSTLDACMTILLVFGRRDVYLPQNSQEMAPHCREELDAESCVKNYARKCLSGFERQVAGMFTLGTGQVIRKRCAPEGTREYLSHYACIKKTIPQMHDAMDQLIYTLKQIQEERTQADLRIPKSCCSFARFQDLASKIVRHGCQEFDPSAEQYISVKMIKGSVGDILELSCQGYESIGGDKCARVKLPTGGFEWRNATTGLVRLANDGQARTAGPKSVVGPIMEIFTSF